MASEPDVSNPSLSLLWPAGVQPRTDRQLSGETMRDLALEALVLTYRQAILLELLRQRQVLDEQVAVGGIGQRDGGRMELI